MAQIVDSYSESNANFAAGQLYNTGYIGVGQSFTGDGGILNSVKFYLIKDRLPTGIFYAYIYAHSGTFGDSSIPTGSYLSISDPKDASTISTSLSLVSFTFSGANKITLANGTHYVLVLVSGDWTFSDGSILVYGDSAGTHHGNFSQTLNLSTWGYNSNVDLCFYVYKDDPNTGQFFPFFFT